MKQVIKKILYTILKNICIYFIPPKQEPILPYEKAEQILAMHSPDSCSSCLKEKKPSTAEYDLSVIVPVYNVEKYLEQCILSIFNQKTEYSYEIIAVNDGSTDSSPQILDTISSNKNLTIIHQENRGLSGARNTALQKVRGKYIMFVDSDDYLTEDAVESLMRNAYQLKADIVQGSYYHVDQTNRRLGEKKYEDQPNVLPNGMIAGMAWGKVYRAELFDKVCFPEGYWFEDTIVTSILTHLSRRSATVSDTVYNYRLNQAGITRKSVGNPKSIDTYYVLRSVLTSRRQLGMYSDAAFYEHLMRLIALCYQRTKNEPEHVKRSMASLFKKMLEDERNGCEFAIRAEYKCLEEAILRGDYRRYCYMCELI